MKNSFAAFFFVVGTCLLGGATDALANATWAQNMTLAALGVQPTGFSNYFPPAPLSAWESSFAVTVGFGTDNKCWGGYFDNNIPSDDRSRMYGTLLSALLAGKKVTFWYDDTTCAATGQALVSAVSINS
jgi:hypothetical protein